MPQLLFTSTDQVSRTGEAVLLLAEILASLRLSRVAAVALGWRPITDEEYLASLDDAHMWEGPSGPTGHLLRRRYFAEYPLGTGESPAHVAPGFPLQLRTRMYGCRRSNTSCKPRIEARHVCALTIQG